MHGEVLTAQHQTKVFYFVALKFAGSPDHHILIDYVLMKSLVISIETSSSLESMTFVKVTS